MAKRVTPLSDVRIAELLAWGFAAVRNHVDLWFESFQADVCYADAGTVLYLPSPEGPYHLTLRVQSREGMYTGAVLRARARQQLFAVGKKWWHHVFKTEDGRGIGSDASGQLRSVGLDDSDPVLSFSIHLSRAEDVSETPEEDLKGVSVKGSPERCPVPMRVPSPDDLYKLAVTARAKHEAQARQRAEAAKRRQYVELLDRIRGSMLNAAVLGQCECVVELGGDALKLFREIAGKDFGRYSVTESSGHLSGTVSFRFDWSAVSPDQEE